MAIVRTLLKIANPLKPELAALEIESLVDTGAVHLCIPEHVAIQLDLSEREKHEVTLADGSKRLMSYVGPVEVRFGNRRCFTGAMVMGDEVLLGAIPMEDMDLVVRPMTREVVVNPASPNVPSSMAKGFKLAQAGGGRAGFLSLPEAGNIGTQLICPKDFRTEGICEDAPEMGRER